jgi:hypothetical protein
MIVNEACALFHGYRLQSGHRPTSSPSVKVLPMYPV